MFSKDNVLRSCTSRNETKPLQICFYFRQDKIELLGFELYLYSVQECINFIMLETDQFEYIFVRPHYGGMQLSQPIRSGDSKCQRDIAAVIQSQLLENLKTVTLEIRVIALI